MKTLLLNADDNVAVALADIKAGDLLESGITALTDVSAGHKVAVKHVSSGEKVWKYGQIIGSATCAIEPGDHVHSHNLGMGQHQQEHAFGRNAKHLQPIQSTTTFNGYHRPDGRVGTRNYLGILTSVNCSGSVARFVAESAEKAGWFDDYQNVDGVVPIVHGTGCGMASSGDGYDTLFRTLSGYAQNPNFGAILMIGLGCEVMQIPALVGKEPMREPNRFRYMTIQQTGGTRKTIEMALNHLRDLAEDANKCTREPAPISKLCIGMQCGGSDGYSGITANPALGVASDLIVRYGGTTILSETSEIFGAEHLLTERAISSDIGKALLERISWWQSYCDRHGSELDNNPSPGNKRGGLTTILEKSLGAVAKAGSAPLSGVYRYAEPITVPGLTFMDSPGYDPCSVTGQIASGANMIVFTTGRGSVSGYMPTPCLKLSSNTAMFERMQDDMDINCGDVLSGISLAEKGQEIFSNILSAASGVRTKSEKLGFGGAEFVPWQLGAVL